MTTPVELSSALLSKLESLFVSVCTPTKNRTQFTNILAANLKISIYFLRINKKTLNKIECFDLCPHANLFRTIPFPEIRGNVEILKEFN